MVRMLPEHAACLYTGACRCLCPLTHLLALATVPLISVAVHTPAHASISASSELLTYRAQTAIPTGTLVRAPLGKREVLGVAWGEDSAYSGSPEALKPIAAVLDGIAALATEGTLWLSVLLLGMSAYQLRRQMWENLRRRFR